MASTIITKTFDADEVEAALRKALKLPADAEFSFQIKMVDEPGDWQASQPLSPEFDGVRVSYDG